MLTQLRIHMLRVRMMGRRIGCGDHCLRSVRRVFHRRAFGSAVHREAARIALVVLVLASIGGWGSVSWADSLIDESLRADMLKRRDGRIAHLESEYNQISRS
jgi:hypothetical protein